MSGDTTEVVLVLCDISGYTRFMLEHGEALRHAFVVVTQLMEAMVRRAAPPLVVAKLEGDAVFLYSLAARGGEPAAQALVRRLDALFAAFNDRRRELVESNICPCGACRNAAELRLKMVLHRGRALFHRVGKFEELAGPDVILAHRLLKNSVPQPEYVLLTEPAYRELSGACLPSPTEAREAYEGFGEIRLFCFQPPLGESESVEPARYDSVPAKAKNILIKIAQSRLMQIGLKRRPAFRHLPPSTQ